MDNQDVRENVKCNVEEYKDHSSDDDSVSINPRMFSREVKQQLIPNQQETRSFQKNEFECGDKECSTLIVSKVPHNITEKCLEYMFSDYGEVIHIEPFRGNRYYEFSKYRVTMENLKDARRAAEFIHRKPPLKLSVIVKESNPIQTFLPEQDDWELNSEEDWEQDIQEYTTLKKAASINVDKFFDDSSDEEYNGSIEITNGHDETDEKVAKIVDTRDDFSNIDDGRKEHGENIEKFKQISVTDDELNGFVDHQSDNSVELDDHTEFAEADQGELDQEIKKPKEQVGHETYTNGEKSLDNKIGLFFNKNDIEYPEHQNDEDDKIASDSDDESFVSAELNESERSLNELEFYETDIEKDNNANILLSVHSTEREAECHSQILPLKITEQCQVSVTSFFNFPDIFLVLPVEDTKKKKEIELKLKSLSTHTLRPLEVPRVGSSCVVYKKRKFFRGNIISISKDNFILTVELVEQGFDRVKVEATQVYKMPEDLWTQFSFDAAVSLYIPQDEILSDDVFPSLKSIIEQEDFAVYVRPEVNTDQTQLVSLILEKRIQKNVFDLLNEQEDMENTGTCDCDKKTKVGLKTKTESSFTSPPLNTDESQPPPLFNIPLPNKDEFEELIIPEPEVLQPDVSLNITQQEKEHDIVFLQDLEKSPVEDNEEYIFLDFGEWSDEAYLLPVYESDKQFDLPQLETVMLESCLYPPVSGKVQVGQVLAAPKQHHNWNKYVRVVVINVKGDEVKVQGLDYDYRASLKMSSLRAVPPDCVSIPVRSRHVYLEGVARVDRKAFRPYLSSIVNKILKKPLTLKVADGRDDPTVESPTVELFCQQVDNVKVNVLIQDELDKPVSYTDMMTISTQMQGTACKSEYRIINILNKHRQHFPTLEEGSEIQIVVLHVDSPNLITVMPAEDVDKTYKMIKKFNSLAATSPALDDLIEPGMICLSRPCNDATWYRSLILSTIDSHRVKVLLLDMGFVVKASTANLKVLRKSKWCKFSVYLCKLTGDWNASNVEMWTNVKTTSSQENVGLKQIEWEGPYLTPAGHETSGQCGGGHYDDQSESHSWHQPSVIDEKNARLMKEEVRKMMPRFSKHLVQVVNTDKLINTIKLL